MSWIARGTKFLKNLSTKITSSVESSSLVSKCVEVFVKLRKEILYTYLLLSIQCSLQCSWAWLIYLVRTIFISGHLSHNSHRCDNSELRLVVYLSPAVFHEHFIFYLLAIIVLWHLKISFVYIGILLGSSIDWFRLNWYPFSIVTSLADVAGKCTSRGTRLFEMDEQEIVIISDSPVSLPVTRVSVEDI